jgi:Tat protein secretion system quality control protein TatD with DNase activity
LNNRSEKEEIFKIRILSNSTDIHSSRLNIELAEQSNGSIIPFVGVHPQIFADANSKPKSLTGNLEMMIEKLVKLTTEAHGLGEVGLDEKYGSWDLQLDLFGSQLKICEEKSNFPINIHSRNCISQIAEILSTYDLSKSKILFHWFAGSENELGELQSKGFFVYFGPAIIFSKRLQSLVKIAEESLILPETDSPLFLSALGSAANISPFALTSVIFKIAEIKQRSFREMAELLEANTAEYLQAQNSLRVKG